MEFLCPLFFSNMFNILLVLGLSSAINPIYVQGNMALDVLYMILLTVIVFSISLFVKHAPRLFGIILMVSYAGYISFKVVTSFV